MENKWKPIAIGLIAAIVLFLLFRAITPADAWYQPCLIECEVTPEVTPEVTVEPTQEPTQVQSGVSDGRSDGKTDSLDCLNRDCSGNKVQKTPGAPATGFGK